MCRPPGRPLALTWLLFANVGTQIGFRVRSSAPCNSSSWTACNYVRDPFYMFSSQSSNNITLSLSHNNTATFFRQAAASYPACLSVSASHLCATLYLSIFIYVLYFLLYSSVRPHAFPTRCLCRNVRAQGRPQTAEPQEVTGQGRVSEED